MCFLLLNRLSPGLGHGVEGRAVVEPLDLTGVEGVGEGNVVGGGAVGGVDTKSHGFANGELSAEKVDLVAGLDLLVVVGVGEGQGKHTLLLQVGLVDTGERAGDDGGAAQVPGLKRSVLTGRTLSVVVVAAVLELAMHNEQLGWQVLT